MLSSKYMVCPDYLHRASNMDYCPSFLTCSPGYVLCDDNTCRKNSTLCPVTRVCPKYTCPFGNCVDDYTLCFSNTICKKGYRLCSDRLCHPRSRDCPSYIDDAHATALESGMKLCRSGDIVSRDIVCPNNVLPLYSPSPSRSSVPSANSSVPTTHVATPRSPAPSLSSVQRDPSISALPFTSSSPVPAADACPTSLSAPRCPCVPPSPLCSVPASSACPLSPIAPSSRPVRPTLPIAAPRASASSTPPRARRASAAPPTSRISAPTGPA